jgi:hypothetical protein
LNLKRLPGIRSGGFRFRRVGGWSLFLLLVVMYLAWPGDNHWGDLDQALYINLALQANETGTLSSCWRQGNADLSYHPFPIWIYQFFLFLTHDLILLSLAKSLVTLSLCLVGLYYLAGVLKYPRWVILLVFFLPYNYFYSPEFTDDSWLIPLSLLAFSAYARFFQKQTTTAFAGTVFLLVLSVYSHPRGAILFLSVAIALVASDRRRLREKAAGWCILLLAFCLVFVPYLVHHGVGLMPGDSQGPAASIGDSVPRFLSVFMSGGLFFSYDLFQLLLPYEAMGQPLTGIAKTLIGLTMIAYLLIISGIAITAADLMRKRGNGSALDPGDRIGGLALLSLFVFSIAIAFLDLFHPVEYYSVVWFCLFFFLWRAITVFHRRRCLRLIPGLYIISMAVSWFCLWYLAHFAGIGLTLSDAVEGARKISQYSPESRIIQNVRFPYGNPVDIMNGNFDQSFGNRWYYRRNVDFINQSELLQDCLKGKYLYTTLVPLLRINYDKQDIRQLPSGSIFLYFTFDGTSRCLVVETCPGGAFPD